MTQKQQDKGASLRDRATHEQSPQAVSAVPVGIPSAMIRDLRAAAKDLDYEARGLRRDARDLELRAATKYDAFIHFDMLADKLEKQLAQAIEAGTAETGTGSACESAVGEADAPDAATLTNIYNHAAEVFAPLPDQFHRDGEEPNKTSPENK